MNKKEVKKILKKNKKVIIAIIVIILISILIKGYFGGQRAQKETQVCDIGLPLGDSTIRGHLLCWSVRQGTDKEILKNVFGKDSSIANSI